jgi:predicted KAP-like P-loop ATPase
MDNLILLQIDDAKKLLRKSERETFRVWNVGVSLKEFVAGVGDEKKEEIR